MGGGIRAVGNSIFTYLTDRSTERDSPILMIIVFCSIMVLFAFFFGCSRESSIPTGRPLDWRLVREVREARHGSAKLYPSAKRARVLLDDGPRLWIGTDAGLALWEIGSAETQLFTAADGLPGPCINALALFDNALWAGTNSGLCVVKGRTIATFAPAEGRPPRITALYARSFELWIGTERGIIITNGKDFWAPQDSSLCSLDVTCITGNSKGVYIGTSDGAVVQTDGFHSEWIGSSETEPFIGRIISMAASRDKVAFSYPLGVSLFDGAVVRHFSAQDGIIGGHVQAIVPNNDGFLLAVHGAGVFDFDGTRIEKLELNLLSLNILSLAKSGETLFVGTSEGAFAVASGNGGRIPLPNLLPEPKVTAIARRGSELWVGTFESGCAVRSGIAFLPIGVERGLPSNRINAMVEVGNALFVGTDRGLAIFNGSTWRTLTREDGLNADFIISLAICEKDLFIGTPRGMTQYNGYDFRQFYISDGLPGDHVTAITCNEDELWAGTMNGLARLRGGEGYTKWVAEEDGLPANWISALTVARGEIFVGTNGAGIARLDGIGWRRCTEEDDCYAKIINPGAATVIEGSPAFGTLENGVAILDGEHWRHITPEDGLPSWCVLSLFWDGNSLWVGTDAGLCELTIDD